MKNEFNSGEPDQSKVKDKIPGSIFTIFVSTFF